ncbi:MAG TPA: FAD-dependent monooxygenase [Pseudonocardia sp.]|jgi:2-polyprenyl-6-methoxyphenol hydroxylase-like FAD-dependent oxidoreductase|uniref:FAD-dependent monooxygenase n=1 Tax=Pseudonocardia sp. TaxID=60912 RepID=UPI002F42B1B1
MVEVLVVGAGPTGLMAGCELARWGVSVRVVDAAPGPSAGSRGKGMQPRTLEVLDGHGVAGRLIATGRSRMPARHYDADGGFRDVDMHPGAEPTPSSPYARSLLVPQWRTEEVLRDRLGELGGRVQCGARVSGLTQDGERVRVTLDGGEVVEAAYVIGCDDGSSSVRRQLGVSFLGTTHEDVRMLLGDVQLDGLDRDHWHMWSGAGSPWLALCPLPAADSFQFQLALSPGVEAEPSLSTYQSIVDEVVNEPHGTRVRLRRASWLSRWRLNVRMVDQYRVGRVCLAGDAAHVHSPAGGQGMNTGIQDAANLGWKLAHVLAGADPALLDSYQAERLPVAAGVLGLSNRLTGQAPGARASAERAESLQLGVSYRGGPLAPKATDGPGPVAGDRAPDAPCRDRGGRPVRLFDLQRGAHWTLLGFGSRPALPGRPTGPKLVPFGIGPAGSSVSAGVDVIDEAGHAAAGYAAGPGELVLIRPDGHIGLRTRDVASVREWLDQLGGLRGGGRAASWPVPRWPVTVRPAPVRRSPARTRNRRRPGR